MNPILERAIQREIFKAVFVLQNERDKNPRNWTNPGLFFNNRNRLEYSKVNMINPEKSIRKDFLDFVKDEYNIEIDQEALVAGARTSALFDGISSVMDCHKSMTTINEQLETSSEEEILNTPFPDNLKEYGVFLKPSFFAEDSIDSLKANVARGFGAEKYILVRVFDDMNDMYSRPVGRKVSMVITGDSPKYNRNNLFDIIPDDELHPRHKLIVPKLLTRELSVQHLPAIEKIIAQLNLDSRNRAEALIENHREISRDQIDTFVKEERQNILDNFTFDKRNKKEASFLKND